MNLTNSTIRTTSQQLENQLFDSPKDIVSWMGAIQAQDYNMCKWAVGVRLKSATISDVENALAQGEILRTHVMRPTWHLVAAEDIRWMLELNREKLKSQGSTYAKYLGITENLYSKATKIIVKMLEGNNHLTRQEIGVELNKSDVKGIQARMIHYFMYRAEIEGIVCSGIDKERKQTYALIDERVKPTKKLNKDEALALLATKYFKSHSPASLQDFSWWAGLNIGDCKQAINLIENDLLKENLSNSSQLLIHKSCRLTPSISKCASLLPAFDEYIISYKDRTSVIDLQHQPKAFTKNGIFHPIVMYNGKIVATWKKFEKKGKTEIVISPFDEKLKIDKELLKKAEERVFCFSRKL
ncbi:MAG: winged helix DNA-binding domain-containing protein [Prevotellaceae bacterium]|nr:winged helix DNA-binding domain-containing protein [Prevotellaceae bacterium]